METSRSLRNTLPILGDAMLKGARPYEDHLIQSLKNPAEASAYLQAALEDNDPRVFLLALKNVALALGGVSRLAKKAKLNRVSLYRTLSKRGNPELTTLHTILGSLGLELAIRPRKRMGKKAA
jgi:probable addiction module antidote protein